ncbi:MAG: folate family ECF transporter S component [Ruminococcaceae bacterium]|nr:folate family ECF transporter S component [Oscillospiraceae bacterium]
MSIIQIFKKSSQNLSKIVPLCVCSMMLALRIVLGMFSNFTLSFAPFVKIGFSFLPIVIVAYLYGPVCAAIVSGVGDILSIVLNNPTAFSIMPGITLCYVFEGIILGVVLYEQKNSVKRIIVAFILVLTLCRLPLNTLVLHFMMGIPYLELLIYRAMILVPFAVIEIMMSYFTIKAVDRTLIKL